MSRDPKFETAIDDLRALMTALTASDWRELHLADGETEIYIAREGSHGNPMVGLGTDGDAVDHGPPPGPLQDLCALHVCTIAALHAQLGDYVEENAEVVSISVLDEITALVAPCGGVIVDLCVSPGELAEFGTVILRIAEGER